MDMNVEDAAPLLLCTLMFLVLCMVSLNVFFVLKNGFYVKVNCWFCNHYTKVLYPERNSFECSYCQQYNGFDKNGDYNKIITAQHAHTYNISKSTSFNGLCNTCNNNISLKVAQLANYEPLDDRNFDVEIDHFEKQLEKTYKLCKTCRKHVSSTIKTQNAWLFARRIKNRNKPNTTSQGITEDSEPYTWLLIFKIFPLVFTILTLLSVSGCSINTLRDLTSLVFPDSIKMADFYNFMSNATGIPLDLKTTNYLPKSMKISEASLLSLMGLILELMLIFFDWTSKFEKLSKTFSWIILILTSAAKFGKYALSYVNTLQIFSCVWLIYTYTFSFTEPTCKKPKNKFVLKKLSGNTSQEEFSDIDDESSIEESISLASRNNSAFSGYFRNTGISKPNSFTANKSEIKSNRLTKVSSLLNIKQNNERLTNQINLYTAKNRDLDRDFNGLNLGVFKQYNNPDHSSPFLRNSISPNNPFMVSNTRPMSQNSLINSPYEVNTTYRSPQNNPFVNVHTENQAPQGLFTPNNSFSTPNSILSSAKSQYAPSFTSYFPSPRESLLSPAQNSAFRPLSSPQSASYHSNRSVLSPPKFVKNFRDNEQLVFTVGSNTQPQSNMVYWPSNNSTVYKSFTNNLNHFESASQGDKFAESSRSSSRSSGFMSGNEVDSRAVSLPNSRNHSPERSVYDNLKID